MALIDGNQYSPVDPVSLETDFRYLTMQSFETAVLVSQRDMNRMHMDPMPQVIRRLGSAIGRKKDLIRINALIGNAYSGETGGTLVTPNTPIAINDHSFDTGTGNVGLTLGKLLNARDQVGTYRRKMGLDVSDLVILANLHQYSKLCTDDKFASFFYNSDKPLASNGGSSLVSGLGMKIIITEEIPKDASGNDQVILADRNALMVGKAANIQDIMIDPRVELQGKVWQIKADMEEGAVRMEEGLVSVITCAV